MRVRQWVRLTNRATPSTEEQGATAVEYAILASLIAAVIAATVGTLGTQVRDLFTTIVGAF